MAVTEAEERALIRKARRKFITNHLAEKLVAESQRIASSSKMTNQYRKSFMCCHILDSDGVDIKSLFYCKRRWCLTCQAITMATQINNYIGVFSKLAESNELYFVTLTRPTCKGHELDNRLDEMGKAWRKITDGARKTKIALNGIRKLECKISKNTQEYHAHFHIIVVGRIGAEHIIKEWLRLNPDASSKAQDYRQIQGVENALLEVFKYTVKLTTSHDELERPMTPAQLNKIFTALYRRRIFQSFGKIKKCNEEFTDVKPIQLRAAAGYYVWAGSDWIHEEYGHKLTNYTPNVQDLAFI